jgi:hypothetical protein
MRVCAVFLRRAAISSQGAAASIASISLRGTMTSSTRATLETEQRLDHALALGGLGDQRVGEVRDGVVGPVRREGRAVASRQEQEGGATSQVTRAAAARRTAPSRPQPPEPAEDVEEREPGSNGDGRRERRFRRRECDAGEQPGDEQRAQHHRGEPRSPRLVRHAAAQARDPGFLERGR